MPPSSRRNVYIQEGRIQRRTTFFDWTRFLVIVSLAVLLFITNPGNESLPNLFRKHLQRETTTFWHSLSPSPSPYWRWTTSSAYSGIVSTTVNTNYGIFSLQKKSSGISISVVLHSLPLCRLDYDSSYSPTFYACDILGKCCTCCVFTVDIPLYHDIRRLFKICRDSHSHRHRSFIQPNPCVMESLSCGILPIECTRHIASCAFCF